MQHDLLGGEEAAGQQRQRLAVVDVAAPPLDDGTVAPYAVIGSLPFAEEIVMPATREMHKRYGQYIYGKYGRARYRPAAFNDVTAAINGTSTIDTSSSMTQVIHEAADALEDIHNGLARSGAAVEFGLVEYRSYPTDVPPREPPGDLTDNYVYQRVLDVGAVLEGSVRREDDRIRVIAQLVDRRSGPSRSSAACRRRLASEGG